MAVRDVLTHKCVSESRIELLVNSRGLVGNVLGVK